MSRIQSFLFPLVAAVVLFLTGCTGRVKTTQTQQPQDTIYTAQKAMAVYEYQPEQALQIIDSAVIAGNLSEVRADFFRARIYSWSVMGQVLDSLLHGKEGIRFDTARGIGERLLTHDSLKTNLGLRQDVLELLVYVARQQHDTVRWLRRSQELVEVCHEQGEDAEPEVLRTEAEVGAALFQMGQRERGMAKLDSVIAILDSHERRQFNWLDATVIALKRKLWRLKIEGKYIETIPLARRIIDRLNDYEQHPQDYHDGSYREPTDSTERADYISFYRTQAQAHLTAVYSSLGEQAGMEEVYQQIESSVRDATAREHINRYHALEQQMLRQQAESHSRMMTIVAIASVVGLLLMLFFATYVFFQNRRIRQKNQVLIRQINQALSIEPTPAPEPSVAASPADEDNTTALFQTIDQCIRSERLYANANIQRQDICDRFNLRREVLNRLLATNADGQSFPNYINGIRLSEACRLLRDEPAKTVVAIADEVGLSPRYLRRLFFEQYGVTPTEYRAVLPGT